MKMKKILVIPMLLAFLPGTALAIDAGTASGQLKVGKERIALKYCFAHDFQDEEGLGSGRELRVLLADSEVPQSMLAGFDGPMKLDRLARDGMLRGVLLRIDPRNPTAGLSGTILIAPRDPRASMLFFTSSGKKELRDFRIGGNRVAGKAAYGSEASDRFKDIVAFDFKASFDAPLFHDEPFQQRLAGPAAAKSPPARAFLAYTKALLAGDFDAAEGLATPEHWTEIKAARAKMGDTEFLGMVRQMTNLSEIERGISKVYIRGQSAVVVIKEKGSRSAQTMRQADGTWRVD
jgi:hypothetical protein